MGIIVRNMSSTGFSNVRIGNLYDVFGNYVADSSYKYMTPDTADIIVPSNTAIYTDEYGFTYFADMGTTSRPMLNAFKHTEDGDSWLSGRSASSSTRRNIGVYSPKLIKPDAFSLISGSITTSQPNAFSDGLLQATTTPYGETPIWETIYEIGTLPKLYYTGVLNLNLNKEYYGFRINSRNLISSSYYYSSVDRFNILKLG